MATQQEDWTNYCNLPLKFKGQLPALTQPAGATSIADFLRGARPRTNASTEIGCYTLEWNGPTQSWVLKNDEGP